jgi:hypothetical protein
MTCHGNYSRDGSRRGIFLRNSLSISSTSSMPCDKAVTWCPSERPILELFRYAPHQIAQKLKVKEFEFGLIVRIQLLLRVPGILDQESVLDCGVPQYQHSCPEERVRRIWISGPTTMGVLGKAHRTLAVVNNHQEEHQSTVLETSGTITDQTLSI